VILTEGWPLGFSDLSFQITPEILNLAASDAWLIPCPPINMEHEVNQQAVNSSWFAGYDQKSYLYPVQAAIITTLLQTTSAQPHEIGLT